MWNPDTYRDTDFGLHHDEAFEPDEVDGDDRVPDHGEPHIQTVLGPIDPDDAGITLMHERLYRESSDSGLDEQLTRVDAALLDLEVFFTVGGRTVVDATTAADGRSAEVLQRIAQRAPVHIVASTGFELGSDTNVPEVRQVLERELSDGLDGTSVLPGMVVLTIGEDVEPSRAGDVFEMIAAETGTVPLPLLVVMPGGEIREDLVATAIECGIAAERLVAVVAEGAKNVEAMQLVMDVGANLLFNELGQRTADVDRATASMIAAFLRDGYQKRILLSHGFNRRSQLTGYDGKPGMGYIIEQFAIMLLEEGVNAQDVRAMLVDNCAATLAVRPRSQAGAS